MRNRNKIREISGASDTVFLGLVYLIAFIAFCITLYPYLYVFSVSVSDSQPVFQGKVLLFPIGFSLDAYREVMSESSLWTAYGNTLYYVLVGTLFNIAATTVAAYPLSRRDFGARRIMNFIVAFTMYFSGGLIPSYLLNTNLGLYNSRWVMILPVLVSTSNLMICRSAFSAIPEELTESARIDGANDLQMFFFIAVRLITPTLAVLTLYYAVSHWNAYFSALLYLSKKELQPLQMLLRRVLLQASSELNNGDPSSEEAAAVSLKIRYVTIVVSTVPILCIYPFIQKYFIKGVMLGAVKG